MSNKNGDKNKSVRNNGTPVSSTLLQLSWKSILVVELYSQNMHAWASVCVSCAAPDAAAIINTCDRSSCRVICAVLCDRDEGEEG